jgi:hypothetical protein
LSRKLPLAPKNNTRLLLFVFAIMLALGAAIMIVVGFADAGILAPEETDGPAPEAVVPGMLPE